MLALAGLKRLNMNEVIESSHIVSWEEVLPAVSQGAIGIQCRTSDERALRYLAALTHMDTKIAVDCERAFLETLDGNCRTPIAGQAKIENGVLIFEGLISKPDGRDMIRVKRTGSPSDAAKIGRDAGEEVKTIAGPKFKEYAESFNLANA
jgi:hydroxymethylbilane synthase